jgi:ABC-type transport system involved in cytochrome bd biosynthesis fused ATPase/permease subunit
VVVFFLATLLALDWPAELGLCRLGRQLELRLRTRFFLKVPRLHDRYFQSRLISDMAFRAHWLQLLRQLPETAGYCLQLATNIVITGIAIAWIYPSSGLLVAVAILAACGVPALFLPSMGERDLRFREISAALGSFYLDSLLGSRAIQAHCAERTLRITQAAQLRQWAAAGLRLQALFVRADVIQMTLTLAMIGTLVYRQLLTAQSPAGVLLLIYWSISIPLLGQEVAAVARSVPAMRNTLLRFLELIGSPEEDLNAEASDVQTRDPRGVKIDMEGLSVTVAGHVVLQDVTLHANPGERIGIVGASGAGKSSLVGVLLGWYKASAGEIRVDDAPLCGAELTRLRRDTAWVDPQVHLFRASLFENLRYGNAPETVAEDCDVIGEAELEPLLEHSPRGLQMPLGEGGAMISGGEGQRVRIGRALARKGVRLAVLDEPARGLGRERRRRMLSAMLRHFPGATLLCVTHDVADTVDLDRVVVIERGRIVEQGAPRTLLTATHSRYRELLEEEAAVGRELWGHPKWRRLRLQGGTLSEVPQSRDSTQYDEMPVRTDRRVHSA